MTVQQDPRGLSALTGTIERRGLRDHVYERVLQMLLGGEVPSGARLSIDTIARQLQVSPTPVREAMVQLERTGLVTREALKGYRVAPPLKPSQLVELFEARLMLETTAARLATPASAAMLAQLRDAQELHRRTGAKVIATMSAGRTDVALTAEYFAVDSAFHRVIFDHCGNHYLAEMSDTLGAQLHRMRQAVSHGITDVQEAIAEHAAVVDAFAGDDPEAPELAMRRHIMLVQARAVAAADS
jgi:DNA-binding GntR family transcriptional regulator